MVNVTAALLSYMYLRARRCTFRQVMARTIAIIAVLTAFLSVKNDVLPETLLHKLARWSITSPSTVIQRDADCIK